MDPPTAADTITTTMDQLPPQFQDLKEQIYAEVRRAVNMSRTGGNHTEGFWDNLQGFLHAVDWQEHWIRGILAGHVLLFLLVLLCRRNTGVLTGVFAALGSLIFFGESINRVAAQHWQAFATQDYFDQHGVFYNAVVSGPALITLFTALICILREAASLMIQVKVKELKHKARQRARAEQEGKKAQ